MTDRETVYAETGIEIRQGVSGESFEAVRRRRRKREQKQCHDYWVSLYGEQAEHSSRGGVTWLV